MSQQTSENLDFKSNVPQVALPLRPADVQPTSEQDNDPESSYIPVDETAEDVEMGDSGMTNVEKVKTVTCHIFKLPRDIRQEIMGQHPELYPPYYNEGKPGSFSLEHVFSLRGRDHPTHLYKAFNKIHRFKVAVCAEFVNGAKVWIGKPNGSHFVTQEVKMDLTMDTQVPRFRLSTPKLEGGNFEHAVSLTLFPKDIKTDPVTTWSSTRIYCPGDKVKEDVGDRKDLLALNDEDVLYEIEVDIQPDTPKSITGLSQAELDNIGVEARRESTDSNTFNYAGATTLAVMGLLASNIRIFLQLPMGMKSHQRDHITQVLAKDYVTEWFEYARQLFTLNGRSPLFFYELQHERGMLGENMTDAVVPRWLVTEYAYEEEHLFDGSTVRRNPRPFKWNYFHKVDVYPDHHALFSLFQLGVARQTAEQSRALKDMLQTTEDTSLTGVFEPYLGEDNDGIYAVFVYMHNIEHLAENSAEPPSVDTRVEILVHVTIRNRVETIKYRGDVQANPSGNKATFACVVRGRKFPFLQGKKYDITLLTVDDRLPNDRRIFSLVKIAAIDKDNKPRGVDVLSLMIAQSTPSNEPDALKNDTSDKDLERFKEVVRSQNLNAGQEQASIRTTQSDFGFELLQGPPGTGKTKTTVTTCGAHASIGRKVAFTSGQNQPVLKAIRDFAKMREKTLAEYIKEDQFVLFDGAYSKVNGAAALRARQLGKKMTLGDEDMADFGEEAELKMAVAEMFRAQRSKRQDPDYRHTFGFKLGVKIQEWSVDGHGDVKRQAQQYLQLCKDLPNAKGQDRRIVRKNIVRLEEHLGLYYLRNVVLVVFCTNSMSCHTLLIEAFSPVVLIIEEAGSANVPDLATPMAVFLDSLLQINMAGDDKQLKAINPAQDRNEAHGLLSKGIFAELCKNQLGVHGVSMLTESYRMVEYLLKFPSKAFYGNLLTAHESANKRDTALQNTLKAYCKSRLGKAWSGNPRVAWDVSGADVQHELFGSSKSRMNFEEAKRIVSQVEDMLDFVPPNGGRKIKPTDLQILTPYTGQWTRQRSTGRRDKEYPIVLVSFVTNTGNPNPSPRDKLLVKWISQPGIICVGMTRARTGLFLYGNFRCWIQQHMWKHPEVRSNKFSDLMGDVFASRDIISVNDYSGFSKGKLPTKNNFGSLVSFKPRP
ncbi:hypothetical protein K505DRAFT_361864 [Melanomma pulvis-pyrius CBS 109.77]|uniref:DNA2/NAM7 helicase-like C-terminal domain-containing protein n=1 Tax=Melanomma pulvis-pyrius CBS 109.77 TaxID=1314802 RepID=A0A6A6XAI1_9PLEO|nr:hypothetical protein K505DRAFT_361864 [Melanomma pulvis-pyrius CBS 109.77]